MATNEELEPLIERDSLIGIGSSNSNIQSSLSVKLASKKSNSNNIQFTREDRNSILYEPDFDTNTEQEEVVASTFYKNHPTYKIFGSRTCSCTSIFSTSFLVIFIICVFTNLLVLLIYPFDDNLYFGGATMQEWIIIFDIAALNLFFLWCIAKIINGLLLILVEFFLHPLIEFLVIQWRMFEIALLGLSWGLCCGFMWIVFLQFNNLYDVSSQMEKIMHDLTIGVILMFSLIGLKVFIIGAYESKLYKKFRHLIALSVREERDLCRIEQRIVINPKERYLTRKFKELDLQTYMSTSPFNQKKMQDYNDQNRITTHVAVATFADILIEKYCTRNDGFINRNDFLNIGRGTSSRYLSQLFDYLDTDKDGKISSTDINIALRNVFKIRKDLRQSMRTRRVLLEVINSICNGLLLLSTVIIILVYVFEINIGDYAVPIATLILAFSFAYQNILSEIVDNMYTLFFVGPFNIGDLMEIGGEKYYLQEVGLLSSACLSENGYMCYISNSLMRKSVFINYQRGKWVKLKCQCYIKSTTTIQDINEFTRRLTLYCANSQTFSSKVNCYTEPGMNPSPILVARIKLKGYANWQNKRKWQQAQTKAILAMSSIAEDLEILDLRNKLHIEKEAII